MRTRNISIAVLLLVAAACSHTPTAPNAQPSRGPAFDGGITVGSGNRDSGVTMGSGNNVGLGLGSGGLENPAEGTATNETPAGTAGATATGVTFGSGN
jgi:hypothetical protein